MSEGKPSPVNRMEMWGGLECTVNRVGNRYFDQLELSGHSARASDIDRIASLGIRTVRYPLLWERTAPSTPEEADWRWADERMNLLRERSITPIAGLVHHGSGPRHTSLLDPRFTEKLRDYARAVAVRYPDLRFVTPINEPLTTARFSALYGHWYPHRRSWVDFVRAILNQCIATREAMKAMREVIPEIELVQTEDLGRVYSTPSLAYQAEFENHRRWLTFDLLCGRVSEEHPMWTHLSLDDVMRGQLTSLLEEPCPPDTIGVNYYVTSDRFLDDRTDTCLRDVGGNGRHQYADVDAVRAIDEGIAGHSFVLSEAWARYRIPLAVTEVHLGCTREHQLRWLLEAWKGACKARAAGCDVRAVTAWALFGSFGWDTLVTREPFAYEPGAFDVRATKPRETALANAIRELASNGDCSHPAAKARGWWDESSRLAVLPFSSGTVTRATCVNEMPRPILVTGAQGTLGAAFLRICNERGLAVWGMSHRQLDIADQPSLRRAIDVFKPWAVVNAAGYVRVDEAETDRASCYRANAFAAGILARECERQGIPLVTYSSDLVFDGHKQHPYVESDRPFALSAYGASKIAAEMCVTGIHPAALVIRTSAFFGPWDEWNFPLLAIRALSAGVPFAAVSDSVVSPTYVPDLVNTSLDLLIDGESGIWHVANRGAVTWSDFAANVASRCGLDTTLIQHTRARDLGLHARRPTYSVLDSERGLLLPSLNNALDRWLDAIRIRELASEPSLQA